MNLIPLNCKTHYSLLKGFCKPEKLASKCAELDLEACGIADYKTVSGAIEFHESCNDNDVKPIIGCDYGDFCLYAKNRKGWIELMRIVGLVEDSVNIIDVFSIAKNGNLICVTNSSTIVKAWEKITNLKNLLFRYDYQKKEVLYVSKEEVDAHRVVLCSGMKLTLPKVERKIGNKEDFENSKYFTKETFHLPQTTRSKKETEIVKKIADMCEVYDVKSKPMLPSFSCPKGFTEDEYLKDLCRDGWKQKLIPKGKVSSVQSKQEYLDRVKIELEVIFNARLSGYFLIVQDIVNYVKKKGWLAGPGRGSAAGCLVSYLLGITEVDPIEFDLLFERFYNEGRNTEDHISLPDIDVDVPAEHRDEVIDYIKEKYGKENVSQMVTYGRLQGRSALKEVMRINDNVSFSEMNEITDCIPDEAMISDQLELMDKEDRSIIRWALINEANNLRKWCYIDEEGNLSGPMSETFRQAMIIEGTNKSQGKHPAGVIISKYKLDQVCPMVTDKSGKKIVQFEMVALEAQGHVKFDILGIDLLSKIMEICE